LRQSHGGLAQTAVVTTVGSTARARTQARDAAEDSSRTRVDPGDLGRQSTKSPRLVQPVAVEQLDEPTEGMWIGVIEEIAESLETSVGRIAVLLIGQHPALALRAVDIPIKRGRLALHSSSAAVRDDPPAPEPKGKLDDDLLGEGDGVSKILNATHAGASH
jgi:hypothetical protein